MLSKPERKEEMRTCLCEILILKTDHVLESILLSAIVIVEHFKMKLALVL